MWACVCVLMLQHAIQAFSRCMSSYILKLEALIERDALLDFDVVHKLGVLCKVGTLARTQAFLEFAIIGFGAACRCFGLLLTLYVLHLWSPRQLVFSSRTVQFVLIVEAEGRQCFESVTIP